MIPSGVMYGSSPTVRRSAFGKNASHENTVNGMSDRRVAATPFASGTSPATRASPASLGSRGSFASASWSSIQGASPASVHKSGHGMDDALVRTASTEPAKVKVVGFDVGGKGDVGRSSAKPPVGLLRAELAGDFTCDVFDSDAYRRAMTVALEIFAEPTVRDAFDFAAKSHAGPGLGPNFDRCVETAVTLAKLGMDTKTVAVGLLHDTLDVTSCEVDELRERFSDEIVSLVVDLSRVHRVSKLHRASGRRLEVEERAQFRAMLLAMTDARVVIVKLTARLIKMRNLQSTSVSQQQRFAEETLNIYAPLAARLGIFAVKNELDDLTFKWMNPAAYAEFSQVLDQREMIVSALTKLDEGLASRNAQVVDLCGRQKSVCSVYKKMMDKGHKLDEIMDLRAIRIIIADGDDDAESERTCREVLESVHSIFTPVKGRLKDYIANPKENGYQSLHSCVRDEAGTTFEIQIRSASMHRTAEYGVAAHWRYKENEKSTTSPKVDQQIQWARFMLSWQNELDDQQKIRPLRTAAAVDCGASLMPCMFPTHAHDCMFNTAEGFCQTCDTEDASPHYVIVVVDGAVSIREVKPENTLADLDFEDNRVPGGARSTEFVRISGIKVNREKIAIADAAKTTLKMGDVVEVTRSRISPSANKSWDETDNVSVFEELNLEVRGLPKSDAVDSQRVHLT